MLNLSKIMGCVCAKEELLIEDRKFEILKKIAEGGFSLIYLVQDARTSKKFAAKQITCHSKREVKLAQAELDLHLKLKDQPNVVSVICHTFGNAQCQTSVVYSAQGSMQDVSELWMIMPYFKFGSLLEELSRRKVDNDFMNQSRVLQLFLGVCKAIQAMHALPPPVAHRDIKPGNVMLSDDGNSSILIDLGSASVANISIDTTKDALELTDQAAEHSTMPYRAPELFSVQPGMTITEKTDIWSLGCLLYAFCFFESPFDAVHARGDSVALAVQAANINIPNNSIYCEKVHSLIRTMVQVEADNRPDISNIIASLHIINHELCDGRDKNDVHIV